MTPTSLNPDPKSLTLPSPGVLDAAAQIDRTPGATMIARSKAVEAKSKAKRALNCKSSPGMSPGKAVAPKSGKKGMH